MDDKAGAKWGGLQSSFVSDEHHQSVNEQSLHILQVIAELYTRYPSEANVTALQQKLEADGDSMWRWIVSLGLIEGTPEKAVLTEAGQQVLEHARRDGAFRGALATSPHAGAADDSHSAAILALLYANFECGHS